MSPWIGPGPDDRDLDDEIVEAARLEARQRVHLRAALDLEDADRVRGAEIVVHRLVVVSQLREVDRDAARLPDVQEAILQISVSMPRPSRSIFTRPAGSRSSFSHWITVRPGMLAGSIGTTGAAAPR